MKVKSNSVAKTQKIAKDFAKNLKAGDIIALFGELGTGKTVFVKGLAAALGVKAKITSPTFVLVKSYPVTLNKKNLTFYHLDLYRIEKNKDLESLGLAEIFSKDAIVVIEWADRAKTLPKKTIKISIAKKSKNGRTIKIDRRG